jgi:cardiolipin synthase
VNAAARSYYENLLACGVKIYVYERGFIHAKTMLVDELLSVVGTANMDLRSFTLNFEVSTLIYDAMINQQLLAHFESDFNDSRILHLEQWRQRPVIIKLGESVARLLAPLL